jgi:hypothetical protein
MVSIKSGTVTEFVQKHNSSIVGRYTVPVGFMDTYYFSPSVANGKRSVTTLIGIGQISKYDTIGHYPRIRIGLKFRNNISEGPIFGHIARRGTSVLGRQYKGNYKISHKFSMEHVCK